MAAQGNARQNKDQEMAKRIAWSREAVFRTEGFASNAQMPSLEECRRMAARNLGAINNQRPQPRLRS